MSMEPDSVSVGGAGISASINETSPATTAQGVARKEFLPRRSGESRFAPPQYFYSASKSGALPIAANSSTPHPTMQPAA